MKFQQNLRGSSGSHLLFGHGMTHYGHKLNSQIFLKIYFCLRFFATRNFAHIFWHVLFLCYQNKCTNICDTNNCNAKNFDVKNHVAKINPQKFLWIYFCHNNFCVKILCNNFLSIYFCNGLFCGIYYCIFN